MNKIKTIILSASLALTGAMVGSLAFDSNTAYAGNGASQVISGANSAQTGNANTTNIPTLIQRVVNTLLFVLGAIAVIMIVLGGIKYTTSNGNADQIKSAKNTVLYAVVGLIVAILAFAIVNFVVTQLTTP